VEFIERQPRLQYFQTYNRIDLGLDLVPYNGGVTSLDAFWMGVPTVTLIGKTVLGRAGWSQLCNLGLPELAAHTPEDYVAIAVRLAGDLPRLQELRATLRDRMRASPLMDGKRFAVHMEEAYRQMWRRWCHENGTTQA
jgi:predicted O-linked N-acetylglucosamine transferase (SPINDLY family)